MNSDTFYWVWLQHSLGFASRKVVAASFVCSSLAEFYVSGERFWKNCGIFTAKELANLATNSVEKSKRVVERSLKLGFDIVDFSSKVYPKLLKKIFNPPCVLYVKGDVECLANDFSISIVGSRNATIYGSGMAFEIARGLAEKGSLVVSGGAVGADAAAHRGALAAGGKTVAVLACGIDFSYLSENEKLREQISNSGALVSEFPPGHELKKFNFVIRNRIISGFSHGTVVAEAGEKSGAILTANFAVEQNRDVFVVPVAFDNPLSYGALDLIRDGARIAVCADDIFRDYENIGIKTQVEKPKERKIPEKFSKIFAMLEKKNMHIDEVKAELKIQTRELLPLITQMEIKGFIRSLPGRFYGIKK
jgi:DNA processing protein